MHISQQLVLRYVIFGALLERCPDSPCSKCLKVMYSCTNVDLVGSPFAVEAAYVPLLPTSSTAFLNFNIIPTLMEAAECLNEHLMLSEQLSKFVTPTLERDAQLSSQNY